MPNVDSRVESLQATERVTVESLVLDTPVAERVDGLEVMVIRGTGDGGWSLCGGRVDPEILAIMAEAQ